jgi:hypothetical protein
MLQASRRILWKSLDMLSTNVRLRIYRIACIAGASRSQSSVQITLNHFLDACLVEWFHDVIVRPAELL